MKNMNDITWVVEESSIEASNFRILSPIPLPPVQDLPSSNSISKIDLQSLPLVIQTDDVLFPNLTYPIAIRELDLFKKLRADFVSKRNRFLLVATRLEKATPPYNELDFYPSAVLCRIEHIFDNSANNGNDVPPIIVCAIERVKLTQVWQEGADNENMHYRACAEFVPEILPKGKKNPEFVALIQAIKEVTIDLVKKRMEDDIPNNVLEYIRESTSPRHIVNFGCAILAIKVFEKAKLLDVPSIVKRAPLLLRHLQESLSMQELKEQIKSDTQEELDKQQKEYFLTQQMRLIQKELGYEESGNKEILALEAEGKKKKWNDKVAETFAAELKKLERLHSSSPDYAVQYQYLKTLLELPWGEYSDDHLDLENAQKILDRDHYALDKIKERIIEHLAVISLRKDMKAPILCLWGPPGVGKTSLGKSIAEVLGRKYVRISLGGLHDEAEIRGHRRTYIGAMPGRIIQGIKKAGTANPVVVLDEIDKIDADYKGDPSSALLEVLDPEQNKHFHDNYVDIDFDLSNVFFIATANVLSTISRPLLDRMELIEVSGYINEEKVEIAKRHLVPKQIEEHGLTSKQVKFSPAVLEALIEGYTRESGVRGLNKQIAAVCRKVAREVAANKWSATNKTLTKKQIEQFLGPPTFNRDIYSIEGYYGVVTGLAWTSVGGEILYIESSIHPGKDGQLILTGNLGNVMKESASIGIDYIRAHTEELGLSKDTFKDIALHVHVPEGAIPKDGPSAGITMLISMLSVLSHRLVTPRIAMTGEMTLRGRVLPVGGIKEKILAAKRAGITDIILCVDNRKDIERIDDIYLKGVTFHYVKDISEVIAIALEPVKPKKATAKQGEAAQQSEQQETPSEVGSTSKAGKRVSKSSKGAASSAGKKRKTTPQKA